MKVFELAKELDIKALDLIEKIRPLNLAVKNHMSELSDDQVLKIRDYYSHANTPHAAPLASTVVRRKKVVEDVSKTSSARSSVVIKRKNEPAKVEAEVVPEPEQETVVEAESVAVSVAEQSSEAVTAEAQTETEAQPVPKLQTPAHTAPKLQTESAPAPVEPEKPKRRFSFLRVFEGKSEETNVRRPVIIEDAVADEVKKEYEDVKVRKQDDDDRHTVERSAAEILKELERDEAQGRKKGGNAFRGESTQSPDFRSTDYLRRERVYQIKKKKLSFGKSISKQSTVAPSARKRFVDFEESMSVEQLADALSLKVREVALKLDKLGVERPEEAETFGEWILDLETAQLIANEFGYEIKDRTVSEDKLTQVDAEFELKSRPPVVTIMGHVDHGKTSLLDFIRKARVVDKEAGGITQHIGAYTVQVVDAIKNITAGLEAAGETKATKAAAKASGKSAAKTAAEAKGKDGAKKSKESKGEISAIIPQITFLDTPGHAAFSSMRARGAQVTDIVVLVVAASEGLMPQTREAIDHAKAAGVPLIIAVNKMDLPDANPDRVLQQLSELSVLTEDWGGETLSAKISAKTGAGVAELLEKIQLQAEILELKAREDGPASGIIIEANLDKGRGAMATVLIGEGMLKVGDYVVVGTQMSKVRALINDQGKNVLSAGASMPVALLGLAEVPEAGDPLNAVEDEKKGKELVELRKKQRVEESGTRKMTLEEMMRVMSHGEIKELPILLKGDAKGSVEAIQGALVKLPTNKVKIKVLAAAVGGISENDVLLASASKAVVIGFNVRPDVKAIAESDRLGVEVKTYTIIYQLLDDIVSAMEGMLSPTIKEEVLGQAEVRNVFNLSRSGVVAGCFVISGKVQRAAKVRVLRQGRVVYTGVVSGLKRFKDDAKEVAQGYECGVTIENFNDIKEHDVLEFFKQTEVASKLEGASA